MRSSTTTVRQITPAIRLVLLVASALVFLVGITLVILPTRTDRYFAWTIRPPLTAAFLGAAYWASFVLEFSASREAIWARARIAIPAVFVFTTLTLVATLLHLELFHLDPSLPLITRAGTWVWLAVYSLVPIGMLVLWLQQLRASGGDPPRRAPINGGVRLLIILQAGLMLGTGAALFLFPVSAAVLWPWSLTPLTSRAVGAWLLGLGVGAAQVAWENDWWRIPAAAIGYAVFAVLELLMIARFSEAIAWESPRAWIYLLFLLSMLPVGYIGWQQNRRADAG